MNVIELMLLGVLVTVAMPFLRRGDYNGLLSVLWTLAKLSSAIVLLLLGLLILWQALTH